ncbi:MAG: hypothetical protein ACLUEK_12260, partial [Oscillospiraceae bacterium]
FENIVVSLGGRVSEKLFLDDISTGASGDIQQATSLARAMVTQFGMSDRLGPISYDSSGHSIFIGRDFGTTKSYSEETAAIIDEEVKRIFDEASAKAESILTEHADILKGIAEYLLANESMDGEDFSYYCRHGELPPKKDPPKPRDNTIEPPAKHISYTFDEPATIPAPEEPKPETEPKGETEPKAETEPRSEEPKPDTEPGKARAKNKQRDGSHAPVSFTLIPSFEEHREDGPGEHQHYAYDQPDRRDGRHGVVRQQVADGRVDAVHEHGGAGQPAVYVYEVQQA